MTIRLILIVWTDWDYFCSFTGLLMIFVAEFQIITFIMITLIVSYIFTILSMMAISATGILLIKLRQLSTLLYFPYRKGKKQRNTPITCIRFFTEHYTITMGYVFIANKTYGRALFFFYYLQLAV